MGIKNKKNLIALFLIIIIILGFLFTTIQTIRRNSGEKGIKLFSERRIGIIEIDGPIYTSSTIIKDIRNFIEDKDLTAVVLRIESPGGGVGASQEIYNEVKKLSEKKVVVASLGGVAASGGYYIACGADYIVANPGTITGSIGVIVEYLNMEGLLKWARLEPIIIKSGKLKDAGNPFRKLKKEERDYLQDVVNDVFEQFKTAVMESRKLTKEEINKIADGRVFTGNTALKLKLVDKLGNFYDAVELAKKEANIEGEPVFVYPRKKAIRLFEKIFEERLKPLLLWDWMDFRISYLWRAG